MKQESRKYIQAEEIAKALGTPRHFMGKILKGLAKEGILKSNKGPAGGFAMDEKTLEVPLIRLVQISRGLPDFSKCALHLDKCNKNNPCALHHQVTSIRTEMVNMLSGIRMADLLSGGQEQLRKTITASDEPGKKENESLNPETEKTMACVE
jgi:Rrf2 family protein